MQQTQHFPRGSAALGKQRALLRPLAGGSLGLELNIPISLHGNGRP